jgi:hypothetical protein
VKGAHGREAGRTAIASVMQRLELMVPHRLPMDFPRLLDILLRLVVELPLELDGFGTPFALRGGRLEVDLVLGEGGEDELVHSEGRSAVEEGMLAVEAGGGGREDDHYRPDVRPTKRIKRKGKGDQRSPTLIKTSAPGG